MGPLENAIHDAAEQARQAIGKAFASTSYHQLSPAHRSPWNRDGFYAALEFEDLAQQGVDLNPLDLRFPVPANCPNWGMAFESDGLVVDDR